LQPGAKLGTYQIERLLGRGGMGVVFLANDTTLHRRVALKVLESSGDGVTAHVRLVREARSAAALNHPNICTIYEVGEASGYAFIAMEYIDGQSLSERLLAGPLAVPEVLRYAIDATEALTYAHDHGVVHRDFKTGNAMITAGGRLKIVDFGLARRDSGLVEDATTMGSLAQTGAVVGTPYSMAPEQVRGEVADARTDIWALGVMFYEMVSATKPFAGGTTPELFSSILRDAPGPLPDETPMALTSVIERCLEKDPRRRYQRASETGAALEAIRANEYPSGRPNAHGPGIAPPLIKPRAIESVNVASAVPRRRVLLGGGFLILAVAASIWFGIGRSERRLSDGNRASRNMEANGYYERALLFGGTGIADPDQAQVMIERALAVDPAFAAARAEYAFYVVARILNGRSNEASLYYIAEGEARRALKDDPRCGRAHSVLALIYLLQGRKELVRGELDHAFRELAADPTALSWSVKYRHLNSDYGIAHEQLGRLLRDWPLYWPGHLDRGEMLREQGDVAGAIREQQRVLEQVPSNVAALAALARAYMDIADLRNARHTLDRARTEDRQNLTLRQAWALLLALEGQKARASEEMGADLQTYAGMQVYGPSWAADFSAVIGDAEGALKWLERAVQMGDEREEYLRRNPLLTNLRAHPRFQQILDSVAYRRKQRAAR